MTPKVSVIIPVYNVEQYLAECLDSVVNQTLREIEIICVDDASTDSSLAILRSYAARDDRIKLIEAEHSGSPGTVRNVGLRHAAGEYVSFVDNDDICDPTMLEEAYSFCKNNNLDMTAFYYRFFRDDASREVFFVEQMPLYHMFKPAEQFFAGRNYPRFLFYYFSIPPWNKLYRRAHLLEHGILFPDKLIITEDIVFTLHVAATGRRLGILPRFLYLYRYRETSGSRNNRSKLYIPHFFAGFREAWRRLDEASPDHRFDEGIINLWCDHASTQMKRSLTLEDFLSWYGNAQHFAQDFRLNERDPRIFFHPGYRDFVSSLHTETPMEFMAKQARIMLQELKVLHENCIGLCAGNPGYGMELFEEFKSLRIESEDVKARFDKLQIMKNKTLQ